MTIKQSSPPPNWGEPAWPVGRGGGGGSIDAILKLLTKNLGNYSDAPQLDAQRIILHALRQREASYLLAHGDDVLSHDQLSAITDMQKKRITGMPLAYILGEADFYGRTFIVTPDVLIPRPDTEILIEKALEYIKARHAGLRPGIHVDSGSRAGMTFTIADVCTGSGCIAITLALEAPEYHYIATDISPAALAVAKQNAQKHGVQDRIEFLQGDMLEPLQDKKIDLIVSNPPYIPTSELDKLRHPGPRAGIQTRRRGFRVKPGMTTSATTPNTRGLLFEPQIALDGGADGLDFVRQIQASKIPAIIETIGGEITMNF